MAAAAWGWTGGSRQADNMLVPALSGDRSNMEKRISHHSRVPACPHTAIPHPGWHSPEGVGAPALGVHSQLRGDDLGDVSGAVTEAS